MRDLMLAPEYLYMTVVLDAQIHNRLEAWIDDRDRLLNTNQVRGEQSLRAQVQTRMREQEQAVEEALGFVRKGPTPVAVRPEEAKPAPKPAAKKPRKRARFDLGIGWDRNLAIVGRMRDRSARFRRLPCVRLGHGRRADGPGPHARRPGGVVAATRSRLVRRPR